MAQNNAGARSKQSRNPSDDWGQLRRRQRLTRRKPEGQAACRKPRYAERRHGNQTRRQTCPNCPRLRVSSLVVADL